MGAPGILPSLRRVQRPCFLLLHPEALRPFRPIGGIMWVIEALRTSILVPHDHVHIKQKSTQRVGTESARPGG